jgi:hypothetical protein
MMSGRGEHAKPLEAGVSLSGYLRREVNEVFPFVGAQAREHAAAVGRELNGHQDELGSRFDTRIEGTRIKHTMGPVPLKMYDKPLLSGLKTLQIKDFRMPFKFPSSDCGCSPLD